jgi:hypothetical protein
VPRGGAMPHAVQWRSTAAQAQIFHRRHALVNQLTVTNAGSTLLAADRVSHAWPPARRPSASCECNSHSSPPRCPCTACFCCWSHFGWLDAAVAGTRIAAQPALTRSSCKHGASSAPPASFVLALPRQLLPSPQSLCCCCCRPLLLLLQLLLRGAQQTVW